MTRVVLGRHGRTPWNAEDRYLGRSDVALDATGRAEAERLGAWAAAAGLSAVWTSPLARCRETAGAVERATGLEARVDERLVELDFGVAEGLTRPEIATRLSAEYDAFRTDPVAHHFPGGERPTSAVARFTAALHDLERSAGDARVLVVTHSTITRLALCFLLGLPMARYRAVFPRLDNGCVSEIDLRPTGCALLSFNLPLGPRP